VKPIRLAVLGIGSVRCGVPIIAALASYFGESDLEVRIYDGDAERLDLFDRLMRRCFAAESAKHNALALEDPFEALEGADMVILAIGENCARRFLKSRVQPQNKPGTKAKKAKTEEKQSRQEVIEAAIAQLSRAIPDGAPVLSMVRDVKLTANPDLTVLSWPEPMTAQQRLEIPYQILRWIRSEDQVGPVIDAHRRSPIKEWLDEVLSRAS
jgi:glycerol-3-phosphate dehydrogenase